MNTLENSSEIVWVKPELITESIETTESAFSFNLLGVS